MGQWGNSSIRQWGNGAMGQFVNSSLGDWGIVLNVLKFSNHIDAQNAPSGFGGFSLIKDGILIEDHYISGTRFRNILNTM
jgi:hypothetical protein